MVQISEVVERVDDGWGFQGYQIKLKEGGTSGFIYDKSEAISRARMEWPLAEDDLSCELCEKAKKASAPYGEWCRDPDMCAGKGYCPRDPTCGD